MKIQYYTATTLDGFIAGEDDSLDWLFSLGDINATSYPEFIAQVGALAMGSSTYEWMIRNADRVAAALAAHHPGTARIGTVTDRAGQIDRSG
jgi:dihydrofolate reductase